MTLDAAKIKAHQSILEHLAPRPNKLCEHSLKHEQTRPNKQEHCEHSSGTVLGPTVQLSPAILSAPTESVLRSTVLQCGQINFQLRGGMQEKDFMLGVQDVEKIGC